MRTFEETFLQKFGPIYFSISGKSIKMWKAKNADNNNDSDDHTLMTIINFSKKSNRFLHTFLGKTGWSATSDRNFVFSRVERSETSEKKQKFLSRVEDHLQRM